MFIDSHCHTTHFSADAKMTIDELLTSSKEKDISKIVITEHYDLDYPHKDEPPMFCDLCDYRLEYLKWKDMFTDKEGPELLWGIEFGYQKQLVNKLEELAVENPFDSIILSNHLFDGLDVWFNEDCYKLPLVERNRKYISTLVEMADSMNCYSIIGHYDYINRYNPSVNDEVLYSDCPKEFDSLFEIIISKEKSLEINTASIEKRIRNNSKNVMPDSEIIKRYLSLGGKMITLGSDAHLPNNLVLNFESTISYLKSLGVKELCYFVNQKPKFYEI